MEHEFGYQETVDLLERLGPLTRELVLVGGQALNFWAERYLARSEALRLDAPFTSKDVDFCGAAASARACAKALGGTCRVPSLDDLTPCTGLVHYLDAFARQRTIDFLGAPYGFDSREIRDMAIPFREHTQHGDLELRVMHPVHVLESRANNVDGLPGYRSARGTKQLRASVVCALEFARDLLDHGLARDVLRLNERIFRYSLRGHGLGVWHRDSISVFDAVLCDDRLPQGFRETRYPQMVRELNKRRNSPAS